MFSVGKEGEFSMKGTESKQGGGDANQALDRVAVTIDAAGRADAFPWLKQPVSRAAIVKKAVQETLDAVDVGATTDQIRARVSASG
ncbi:hypothetical protein KKB40_05685 [Patescibacteria group bacterium]|nr:hypothetical protein [Patescibacteria group bacterium]